MIVDVSLRGASTQVQAHFIHQQSTIGVHQSKRNGMVGSKRVIRHSPFVIRHSSFATPRRASTADPEGGKYGSISQPIALPGSG